MKNTIPLILIILSFGCQEKAAKNNKQTVKSEEISNTTEVKTDSSLSEIQKTVDQEISKSYSLKDTLQEIEYGCLVIEKPNDVIRDNLPYENYIDRTELPSLYSKEITDSIQFEKAHILKPLCRIYSNENIDVVAFTDVYDYQSAIHLFTFKKKNYSPLSSFILYSTGGDAEDFWRTIPIQKDSLSFELTDEVGYVNDVESRDTTYIKSRRVILTTINSSNGSLSKEILNSEVDLIEIK